MSSSSGIAAAPSAYVEFNLVSPRMITTTASLSSSSSSSPLRYTNNDNSKKKKKTTNKNMNCWKSELSVSSSHQSSTPDFNLNLNHGLSPSFFVWFFAVAEPGFKFRGPAPRSSSGSLIHIVKCFLCRDATDPELRAVLELATTSELFELHHILSRPSYFSPLLKSVPTALQLDPFMIEHDFQERLHFITSLESRFLFLAADARSTLRGWRPSYRNVLLDVRKELKVPCSTKLSVEDLEIEIFIFMIQECSRDNDTAAAVRFGVAELCSALLKGGQLVSLLKISQMVSTKLSGKMLLETTKHKFGNEAIKKGLTGATSRYLGLGSLASLFGPMLWGTFLADVVIQMLGTDYIRILQAIYALAQIRILRRHGLHLDKLGTDF